MADAVLRKVAWRLVPLLGLGYFFAFLDRVNVGFAALTMNADIGLSAAAYGFGAGIFFIGYVLFEVPSNVILARVGARVWIARILISWGLLSAAMALVEGPASFFVLRFLLGIAEAGFFPGILYFLSCWFPSAYRARVLGAFMIAIPLSGVLGAPLSTHLLGLEGLGLAGWQWMFILEGLPAVLLGFAALRYLRDRPADAEWLEPRVRRASGACSRIPSSGCSGSPTSGSSSASMVTTSGCRRWSSHSARCRTRRSGWC
jgi:ACS family tartrate transporter-like MFS transporter